MTSVATPETIRESSRNVSRPGRDRFSALARVRGAGNREQGTGKGKELQLLTKTPVERNCLWGAQ